jgi:hypothetical protein
MSDEDEEFVPTDNLENVVKKGDYRESLIALRDYVAHELEGNRCKTCSMSKLKTGDTASLVLRLQKIIEDIRAIPDPNEEVDEFDALIAREAPWASTSTHLPPPADGR